jgi:predicted enzyme related to lactoylglutathione lyase
VGDVDATLAKVVAAGGKIAMPSASGDYGTVAHFEDSEGNVVGLYGDPKPAK